MAGNSNNESVGTPIQILKKSQHLEIDEDALYKVLCHPDVGKKEISVVSVVGPHRTGKSFLLNYFLRYLERKGFEDDTENSWIEIDEKPLEGFSWGGGIQSVTTGIFIWSKPFIIKRDSREIAVFLLDSQGIYSLKSSRNIDYSSFMLTLLMSSCTIYNLQNKVGDNDLQYLEVCVEYAKEANKSKSSSCSLQNFWFLVRDWGNPVECDYGADGGQKYLDDDILAVADQENPTNLDKTKKSLKESFEDLRCYLMPWPGQKAAIFTGRDTFQGNAKELDPQFVMHLKHLCRCVLHPSKLSVKPRMTGVDLFELLLGACENIRNNPDDLPKSLLKAWNHLRCTQTLVKVRDEYREKVQQKLGETFHKPEKFKSILDEQRKRAQKNFIGQMNVSEQNKQDYEDRFTRYISVVDMEMEANNDRLWMIENGKLAEMAQRILSIYKGNMEKAMEPSWRNEAEISKHHEECLRDAEKEFESELKKMKASKQGLNVRDTKKSLNDGIDCTYRTMILEFQYEEARNLYAQRKVIFDSSEKYKEAVKSYSEERAREISLQYFSDHTSGTKWTFGKEDLFELLHGCFSTKYQEHPMLNALYERYYEEVLQETRGKVCSERKLNEIKEKISADAMSIYKACKREAGQKISDIAFENWKNEIEELGKKHHEINELNKIKIYVDYFELVDRILEEIKEKMKRCENVYIGEPLKLMVTQNQQTYLARCEKFESNNYMSSDNDIHVRKFRDHIQELCDVLLKRDGAYALFAEVKLRVLEKEIAIRYLTKLEEEHSERQIDIEEFHAIHDSLVADVLAPSDGPESEMIGSHREQIEAALNDHFEKVKIWNEQNKKFFKRSIAGAASGVGIAAGAGAGTGTMLGLSLDIGLVTVGLATAATGIGAAVVAGVAVGAIGYGVYRATKKTKLSEYIAQERANLNQKDMAEMKD